MYDVIVVGGGPAGLSAALMLGRCRRRVLLCDEGEPRNRRSSGLHGYLTRDGIAPADFNAAGRRELAPYGVDFLPGRVSTVRRNRNAFDVSLAAGDASRDAQFVVVAAAEGVKAAMAINQALQRAELRR